MVVMGTVKGHTPGDMQAANYGKPGGRGSEWQGGGRKRGGACGSGICIMSEKHRDRVEELIPLSFFDVQDHA